MRPGEKLHEQMIGEEDAPYTYEYDQYLDLPQINDWFLDQDRIRGEGELKKGSFTTAQIIRIG